MPPALVVAVKLIDCSLLDVQVGSSDITAKLQEERAAAASVREQVRQNAHSDSASGVCSGCVKTV